MHMFSRFQPKDSDRYEIDPLFRSAINHNRTLIKRFYFVKYIHDSVATPDLAFFNAGREFFSVVYVP